ncbi:DUF5060 domain-containing protein [Lewinella sp. 4G2]|uniref:DUF5060 domain-containing protein n=1 Tax=Lewinella sp. 4G2 TaxID=1803372 RepID=UPI0007E0C0DF|nr:DUF5060 domain-containing protein [Lewinella sp. 4G2]OAV43940.1 hypothetical protein A3850_005280 [Lewinella sp. 4G2]
MQHVTLLLLALCLASCGSAPGTDHEKTVAKWELTEIDFEGPSTSENAAENPFTTYQMDVAFTHENGQTLTLPAFYAADGNAAETGADAGAMWRVRFRAPEEGTWNYTGSLQKNGTAVKEFSGSVLAGPAKPGERGRLQRTHPRYLQWAETEDYFLKGGTDSPENLLGYFEFDSTYRHLNVFREGENQTVGLHKFADHAGDFTTGPTWQDGKGKNLMGALQYLHDHGVNSFYALTMNINGDGKDVWPFVNHETLDRFDVSKLAQWERVFQHADDLGMMIHLVLQETENETLQDGGDTGPLRQLYFRELIARFGHHRALTWNLGEENGPNHWSETAQTTEQQRAMIAYLSENDPWKNHVVLHTHPSEDAFEEIYRPLLGNDGLTGLALQIGEPYTAHEVTQKWLKLSADAGAPWIMTLDEVGPWFRGLDPDTGYSYDDGASNNQDSLRALTLWANLMAGGAGVEWYSGAKNENNDLNTETFRTRERAWEWTTHARRFFEEYLPFHKMESMDELVEGEAFCFAQPGEVYAVYLPFGDATSLDLRGDAVVGEGAVSLAWYNPREGVMGEAVVVGVEGGQVVLEAPGKGDWAVLVLGDD